MKRDLTDVVQEAIRSALAEVHVSIPGRVVKYDAETRTVDVQPVVLNVVETNDAGDRATEERPVIPNVPIGYPRGGGFWMRFPLVPGDHVWLVFSEQSIAQWRTTGEVSEPGDLRRHGMSYPIALPCVGHDKQGPPDCGDALVLGSPGGTFTLDAAGNGHMTGSLTVDGEVTSNAKGAPVTLTGHVHPTGVGPSGPGQG